MTNAPIILFCYNRPRHLKATLTALATNTLAQSSSLYIYADGEGIQKRGHADFMSVRSLIREQRWKDSFDQVEIIENATNLGLAESVIRGVSEVVGYCGKIIVLEDDVVVSPYFLEFMNRALQLYMYDEAIGSIRAHIFDIENLPSLFFARMSGDFAWGTWQRAWKRVSFDGKALFAKLKQRKLTHTFDYDDCYPYTQMLRDQIAGRNSSWGVRFYASLFLEDMLTLYPGKSLAVHIGYDDGTHFHGNGWNRTDGTLFSGNISLVKLKVEESQDAREKMKQLFREEGFASFWMLRRMAKAMLPHWLLQGVLQRLRFRGRRNRIFQEKAKLSGCAARLPPNISPKVSFLVAAHNYEEYIEKCLQSVLAQRDVAWDLLVVDDCSSDQTWDICRDYAERDSRIRAVRLEQNLGQYQIINRYSLELVGEYCCVLDADDYLASEYVGKMYKRAKAGDFEMVLCRHQNLAGGKKLFVHDYGAAIGWQGWNHSLFWPLLQLEYFIVDCGTLVKTELRRRVYAGLPNVKLYAATDDVQALFLARHARSIAVCKKALYYHNQSSSGTWRNSSEAFCIKKLASALVALQVIQELACEELGPSGQQIECAPNIFPMAQNIWNMALQAVAGLSAQQREELSTKLLEFSSRYQNGLLSPQILKKWETKWQNELEAETTDKTKSPQKLADAGTLWTARRIAKTRIKEALRRAKCYLPYFLFCLLWRIRRGKYGLGHENCRGFRGFSLFPPGSSVRWFWYALPYGFVCRCLRYQKRNIAKK